MPKSALVKAQLRRRKSVGCTIGEIHQETGIFYNEANTIMQELVSKGEATTKKQVNGETATRMSVSLKMEPVYVIS